MSSKRYCCPRGCEGTEYKIVTTKVEDGETVRVCRVHGEPITEIKRSEMSGHTKFFHANKFGRTAVGYRVRVPPASALA